MVVLESPHFTAENSYLSSLEKTESGLDVKNNDGVSLHWSFSPSVEGSVGSLGFGEEGLTQSPSSEKDDCDEVIDTASQCFECGVVQESQEARSVFDEIRDLLICTPLDQHPFFNMDKQRSLVESERSQRQYEFFISMGQRNTLPLNEQNISSKSLLNEAHRVHVSLVRRHNKTCQDKGLPMKNEKEINRQWRCIESAVERDLYMEGTVFVQRRLSCMCIFNPDSDERPYWDSEHTREQRLQRQGRVLERLAQQAQHGQDPFFLH
ncbi:uncharacterized protein TM35_000034950 [Trypanosoma theileri]|uniref:Uncharacterized protein n=1 Tax=Trypanosoma theileri TaxID=67003 RepID=A0A1X0P740_9TRYP|nr:uncharacterized protein TM35_000034950 [Trypanosoma theileri]ORC92742.1 hypothetical protein TM35_000034950 [Trypanosoma theileri]